MATGTSSYPTLICRKGRGTPATASPARPTWRKLESFPAELAPGATKTGNRYEKRPLKTKAFPSGSRFSGGDRIRTCDLEVMRDHFETLIFVLFPPKTARKGDETWEL